MKTISKSIFKGCVKRLSVVLITCVMLAACNGGNAPVSQTQAPEDIDWVFYTERAESFVQSVAGGDYDAAADMFDKKMKQAYSAAALQTDWELIVARAGAFTAVYETENLAADGYYICHVTSRHELTGVKLRLVFSEDGLVAGFFVADYPVIGENEMDSVQREGFTDFPVTVGEGTEFPLSGVLSVPDNAAGKLPAVVIVQGSGPMDMDGNVYGTALYRDIAEYLAANGIAVLRYNKRTFQHGAALTEKYGENITVREETIDDAIAARALLDGDERIDKDRIFLLGHSLGGMLAPRMIEENGGFAGGVIMAGSPRDLLDIIYDQNLYFIGLTATDEERGALLAQVDEMRASYFGQPALYFDEMNAHPASDFLRGTDKPFLIMQGGKDFQVYADKDFAMYKEIVGERGNFTFKLYDGLNHLFMLSVMENPTTDDYVAGSKAELEPLADIAAWINEH